MTKPPALPAAQATAMARCVDYYTARGRPAIWHRIECECCLTVHEDLGNDNHERLTGGFIVGQDGGVDWITLPDGRRYAEPPEVLP